MINERFWSFVHGVFLALIIGWVLNIGQDIFIPIIFSVLVGFVIIGMTRMLAKVPVLGPRLSIQVRYIVAALIMAVGLASVVWLLVANVARAVALAPQYQDSLLNSIQNLAVTLGLESEPSWKSLRQQFLAQVSIQRSASQLRSQLCNLFAEFCRRHICSPYSVLNLSIHLI